MIGKVLVYSFVGGTTMAIYMTLFNDHTQFPVAPPLQPIGKPVIMHDQPKLLPKVIPLNQLPALAPAPAPKLAPKPTERWPGQHYGETVV